MLPLDKIFLLQLSVFLIFVLTPITWLALLYFQGKATFSLFSDQSCRPIGRSKISENSCERSNDKEFIKFSKTASETLATINLQDLTDKTFATTHSFGDESSDQRRKEIELEAMKLVLAYEKAQGRKVEDVSMYYAGYDIKSFGDIFRAIEVKGKSATGKVFLTPNEWKTAKELGESYFIYIVENISTGKPKLKIIQDPTRNISVSPSKVQYVLSRKIYSSNADDIIQLT